MKSLKNSLWLIFLFSFSITVLKAQELTSFTKEIRQVHKEDISKLSNMQILEDSLVFFADSMYYSDIAENRIEGSYAFIKTMKSMLKTTGSYQYPFAALKDKIVVLDAPDKSFRIYNWEIIRSSVERRYYGVIQLPQGDFIPLVDASDQIVRGGEDSVFVGTRWFGCLYYNIVQKDFGGQKINFLFGWNASNMNSERKLIEAFGFNSKGQNVFGAPLFSVLSKNQRKQANRFIIEYQKGAKVSLNFDKERGQIIFDHCESQIGDPAKKYTYIPDGTYDGLIWDGQNWKMQENIVQILELQNGAAPIDKPIK